MSDPSKKDMSGEASGGASGLSQPAFQPKEELLKVLLEAGISKNAAIKGLFHTGNYNAELAAAWVFDNEGKEDMDEPLSAEDSSSDELEEGDFLDESDFYKMVFAVNMDLKMGVGKAAAQVGHASIGLYKEMCEHEARFGEALLQWEQFGETKIVLKGHNAMHLEELHAKATSLDLATYMVHDAGRTQIAAGSTTVIGIMGRCDVVDRVTGQLSLL